MEISLVPPEMVPGLWPHIFPHLAKAAEYTFGRYEPEDIFEFVTRGGAHMWVALDDEGVKGVTVTRFWEYPRKRCLDVVFLGGESGDEWKDDLVHTLKRWAKDSNCDVIESSGRPGFARVFKDHGYTPLWQVFELPVNAEGIGG